MHALLQVIVPLLLGTLLTLFIEIILNASDALLRIWSVKTRRGAARYIQKVHVISSEVICSYYCNDCYKNYYPGLVQYHACYNATAIIEQFVPRRLCIHPFPDISRPFAVDEPCPLGTVSGTTCTCNGGYYGGGAQVAPRTYPECTGP
jgi:hypothetical protein